MQYELEDSILLIFRAMFSFKIYFDFGNQGILILCFSTLISIKEYFDIGSPFQSYKCHKSECEMEKSKTVLISKGCSTWTIYFWSQEVHHSFKSRIIVYSRNSLATSLLLTAYSFFSEMIRTIKHGLPMKSLPMIISLQTEALTRHWKMWHIPFPL